MNTIKIKSGRAEDRPYERCLSAGPESLTDAELLAVILRSGTAGRNAVELADDILRLNRAEPGLPGLSCLTLPELTALPGIGQVKAIQLLCVAELTRRIARTKARERLNFDHPETIAAYYMEELRTKEREYLYLLLLDTRNHLIADKVLTIGTINQSLVSVREIFLTAIRYQAVSLILVHNHPSGDPTPSSEDLEVTGRVACAGSIMDIGLLDHIIIGNGCYKSFKEEGLIGRTSFVYGKQFRDRSRNERDQDLQSEKRENRHRKEHGGDPQSRPASCCGQ